MESSARRARDKIVHDYWTVQHSLSWPKVDTIKEPKELLEKRDLLLRKYADSLSFTPLGRCPFCNKVLKAQIDVYGLDGMYWAAGDLTDFKKECCEHFIVFLGAIDFKGRTPVEAAVHSEVLVGPDVPYVIPTLLQLTKASLFRFSFPLDDIAYVISYFSEKPLAPELLHQAWGRAAYRTPRGWMAKNDPWDFNIDTWIAAGRLFWLDDFHLKNDRPSPYSNLPGVKKPQKIERGKLSVMELPNGKNFEPFE